MTTEDRLEGTVIHKIKNISYTLYLEKKKKMAITAILCSNIILYSVESDLSRTKQKNAAGAANSGGLKSKYSDVENTFLYSQGWSEDILDATAANHKDSHLHTGGR